MATFNAWHDEIERNGKVFSHATNMVQKYKNIIDIVGKDKLGVSDELLQEMEQLSVDAAQGAMHNAKV
jgi:hypothetical protein